jgi:hypothetical protein
LCECYPERLKDGFIELGFGMDMLFERQMESCLFYGSRRDECVEIFYQTGQIDDFLTSERLIVGPYGM